MATWGHIAVPHVLVALFSFTIWSSVALRRNSPHIRHAFPFLSDHVRIMSWKRRRYQHRYRLLQEDTNSSAISGAGLKMKGVVWLWEKCDFVRRPVTLIEASTVKGHIVSGSLVALLIALFAIFLSFYFTQTTTGTVSQPTEHEIYPVSLRCISHTGCNITHKYTVGTPCAIKVTQSGVQLGTTLQYKENATFSVLLCGDQNSRDGVVFMSSFDSQIQLINLDRSSIGELAQPNRQPIPLPGVSGKDYRRLVTTLIRYLTIRDISKTEVLKEQWNVFTSTYSHNEQQCPTNLVSPWTCVGYLLKPVPFFVDLTTTRRYDLWNDVWGNIATFFNIGVTTAAIVMAVKITRPQLDSMLAQNKDGRLSQQSMDAEIGDNPPISDGEPVGNNILSDTNGIALAVLDEPSMVKDT